jgi:hypothetical protein
MGRLAQISPTHFGRKLLCGCRYRGAKAQYGGDDFLLLESLPLAWRWKRNSAVRQVNARFEVGFGRRGVSRRAPPLTLSANALYVGQVVTWAAAKLPQWSGEFRPALILVGGALC